MSAQARVALVIGNSAYQHARPLATVAEDATIVAETMRAAGYEVVEARDVRVANIGLIIRQFLDKVTAAGPRAVAYVYFAGYAAQSHGENFLVPVDARIDSDDDVANQGLRVNELVHELLALPAAARLIVLDAARDHDFGRGSSQPVQRGLAPMNSSDGMLIAASAAPGAIAIDGDGHYSIYTTALVKFMRQPGLDMEQVFKATRAQVNQSTGGRQTPWMSSSLAVDVRLFDAPAAAAAPAAEPGTSPVSLPVEGTWLSNWGPVTFVPQVQADGTHIRGFLQQWPGQKGTITDGHYDAAQRKLSFSFFQEWNSLSGNATLALSPDGKTLTGTWQTGKGHGPDTMQFLFRGDPPKAADARPHNMTISNKPRLEVLPVLFIARDADWITPYDIDLYSYLIFKHLELAQRYYKDQLETDTFKIADEPVFVYRAQYNDDHYLAGHTDETLPGTSQMFAREILAARHEDRYSTNKIYLVVYVRAKPREDVFFGGGRTFNGAPNTGGGIAELELDRMLNITSGFQMAVNHELGHTFGLQHPDAYGYDQYNNQSIMSYDPKIGTTGFDMAKGRFNPEDFYTLSLNKRAFPDFRYQPVLHNPQGRHIEVVSFGCMTDYIGQRRGFKPNSCMQWPCPCH